MSVHGGGPLRKRISFDDFLRLPLDGSWTFRALPAAQPAALATAHRLPQAEYTRLILQAKEGGLTPGEADRRILRFGGRVKLRKLGAPPR